MLAALALHINSHAAHSLAHALIPLWASRVPCDSRAVCRPLREDAHSGVYVQGVQSVALVSAEHGLREVCIGATRELALAHTE